MRLPARNICLLVAPLTLGIVLKGGVSLEWHKFRIVDDGKITFHYCSDHSSRLPLKLHVDHFLLHLVFIWPNVSLFSSSSLIFKTCLISRSAIARASLIRVIILLYPSKALLPSLILKARQCELTKSRASFELHALTSNMTNVMSDKPPAMRGKPSVTFSIHEDHKDGRGVSEQNTAVSLLLPHAPFPLGSHLPRVLFNPWLST